jgi:hypothetical protein
LRTSERGDADGVVAALEKIVAAIRQRCVRAQIVCAATADLVGTIS